MRVWCHASRDTFERGWRDPERLALLVGRIQMRRQVEGFAPVVPYHATVLIVTGTNTDRELAYRTTMKLLHHCPLGFEKCESYTVHIQETGRPFIGLVVGERLDKAETAKHFTDCGVVPDASG